MSEGKIGSTNPQIGKYILCRDFGYLPSEVDNEDADQIEWLLFMHSAFNRAQNKLIEKKRRQHK